MSKNPNNEQNDPQVERKGLRTEADMRREFREAIPRDNLSGAFAGNQNKGPAGHHKESQHADTHVKSRRRPMDEDRSPKK